MLEQKTPAESMPLRSKCDVLINVGVPRSPNETVCLVPTMLLVHASTLGFSHAGRTLHTHLQGVCLLTKGEDGQHTCVLDLLEVCMCRSQVPQTSPWFACRTRHNVHPVFVQKQSHRLGTQKLQNVACRQS